MQTPSRGKFFIQGYHKLTITKASLESYDQFFLDLNLQL